MTTYSLDLQELENLKDKTVLIIGAATGIGRAAVDVAHERGANVAIGDWNEAEGLNIVEKLKTRVFFRKCDVSNWNDVLHLFHETWLKFGPIHAVLSNAGINTNDSLLEDEYDPDSGILLEPNLKSIEVNLIGQIYVVKCAMHYIKHWPEIQTEIVLTASAGSFFPAPPIHLYCAAKSGVLGLMRALRYDMKGRNATINAIAPWLTLTPMLLPDWLEKWGKLPKNTCEGVAHALFLPVVRPDVNGKAFFVAGDKIIEFEDTLQDSQPHWMGKELSDDVNEGQRLLTG
ncbi:NAD(P)-binding protein [Plenodomus tracheiphilus IPT5]|uniref:NAD(P)-binding protein n=1 Tax=Plenodomus tracheiphilus IPT5 TaxID=1408161 RepID=A0A6A7BKS9_9PLEO|nr:NAD(P)-binding protein [Plenodomus tracheiphilus IPT5]